MPRYRSLVRSDEQKRNLKVDLRRIPEWEAEIKSFPTYFKHIDLAQIKSATLLINKMRQALNIWCLGDWPSKQQEAFEKWESSLCVNDLIHMSDYSWTPEFLRLDYELGKDIVEIIRSGLKEAEKKLAEFRVKGITNSLLISLVTSKIDVKYVKAIESERDKYLGLLCEIPRIENARKLLLEVHSESVKYVSRERTIRGLLSQANEKKEAIERFEAKYGKAFAKAAAADNQTRGRAASLKRLVKKTIDCPYCGADLGLNPHLDHIYPVSKGGLSIVENLVWCCSVCNGLKTDKGLIQFLKVRGVHIEHVLSRLHSLGKHV